MAIQLPAAAIGAQTNNPHQINNKDEENNLPDKNVYAETSEHEHTRQHDKSDLPDKSVYAETSERPPDECVRKNKWKRMKTNKNH